MLRHPLALFLLALLPLSLGGCLFDQPLTSPDALTSPNIDSRLLGVFEFREGAKVKPGTRVTDASAAETGTIHRLAVLPLSPNYCVIYYRDFSKKPARTMKFLGWLSRVDSTTYLSVRDDTEGSSTFGKYGFFLYEWEFPGNFLLRAPDPKQFEGATSPFAMRRILRARLKDDTAFPFEATYWKKIARIWWDPKGAQDGATIPPEFQNGTTRDTPGL